MPLAGIIQILPGSFFTFVDKNLVPNIVCFSILSVIITPPPILQPSLSSIYRRSYRVARLEKEYINRFRTIE